MLLAKSGLLTTNRDEFMTLTLKDLDNAFDNIWQHSTQIPALLDVWYGLVDEFLTTVDATMVNEHELNARLDYWDALLTRSDLMAMQSPTIINSKTLH